jgi:hypothetical protein
VECQDPNSDLRWLKRQARLLFSRLGCAEEPRPPQIFWKRTCCVRVWEVSGDLPFGFNYVDHPVFKKHFLFLQSFPLTYSIRQRACFLEPKETEKLGFRFVCFESGFESCLEGSSNPKISSHGRLSPYLSLPPSFILPPSFPSPFLDSGFQKRQVCLCNEGNWAQRSLSLRKWEEI